MSSLLDAADIEASEDLRYNPALAGEFIAQEIEFLLPEIIQSLEIPVLLDAGAKQRLEYSLQGRKGFRALAKAGRAKAVDQLKDFAFANALRNAQQTVLTCSQGNSSSLIHFFGFQDTPTAEPEPFLNRPMLESKGGYPGVEPFLQEVTTAEITPLDTGLEKASVLQPVSDVTSSPMQEDNLEIFEIPKIPIELQEPIAGRDIRGLLALLRSGKLVAFVEDIAGQLVGQDIEKIQVPNKKVFANLAVDSLLAEYQALSSTNNLVSNAQVLAQLRLIDALLVAVENDEQWSRINTRRFHLILKKHTLGLSTDEDEELTKLEELAERKMYSALELPFAELAMLEAYAASIGLAQTAA